MQDAFNDQLLLPVLDALSGDYKNLHETIASACIHKIDIT